MINYNTIGKGENLVLLHGFGFCGDIFLSFIEKYSCKYRITIIDLPGHGNSKNIQGLDKWAIEIAKIIPKNSIILGWSLGGLVAIKLAKIVKITRIILIASSPKFIKDNNWDFGIERNDFTSFASNIKLDINKGLIRFVSLQGLEKYQIKILKTIIKKNLPTIIGLNNALEILLTTDLRHELLEIKNIEIFLGKKDTIVPKNLVTWYQKNNIKTTILSGGHIPFLNTEFCI